MTKRISKTKDRGSPTSIRIAP